MDRRMQQKNRLASLPTGQEKSQDAAEIGLANPTHGITKSQDAAENAAENRLASYLTRIKENRRMQSRNIDLASYHGIKKMQDAAENRLASKLLRDKKIAGCQQ
ncbi:hypothetical protein AVEN_101241-1 [Araneus ventricosus]|uniref:Uncharacterized protein n=1 Tax=Araneus ventricosus TaxID=182803 RepID=A0A4Y2Q7F8_ARAVE|nr:hypothetical protein AVEN_101241-1 [Araneus ventricosus]